jgi:hypothetical protein
MSEGYGRSLLALDLARIAIATRRRRWRMRSTAKNGCRIAPQKGGTAQSAPLPTSRTTLLAMTEACEIVTPLL